MGKRNLKRKSKKPISLINPFLMSQFFNKRKSRKKSLKTNKRRKIRRKIKQK